VPGAATRSGQLLDLAAQRMLLSMRALAASQPGGTAAAVSPAATARLLISATTGSPRDQWRLTLPNGGITVFEATPEDVAAVLVPNQVVAVE
jgi:broad specificity phosphatase PhoE